MITAKFEHREDRPVMTLTGHAGTAPRGEDLVCAAATMLVYTLAQAVCFHHEQGQLKEKPEILLAEGNATVAALPREETAAEVMHTFWVIQAGFFTLAHNYPHSVTLEPMRINSPMGGKEDTL